MQPPFCRLVQCSSITSIVSIVSRKVFPFTYFVALLHSHPRKIIIRGKPGQLESSKVYPPIRFQYMEFYHAKNDISPNLHAGAEAIVRASNRGSKNYSAFLGYFVGSVSSLSFQTLCRRHLQLCHHPPRVKGWPSCTYHCGWHFLFCGYLSLHLHVEILPKLLETVVSQCLHLLIMTYDLSAANARAPLLVVYACTVIAVITTVLRIRSKWLRKARVVTDDYLVVAALVSQLPSSL